ncbi:hypothetical protein M413DRAFT_376682 [Hebeloma cylindrosporum]|uniref:Uncharacterized protein n=1 Tax=Hebeloma cylindrosporum TaxID=76867 RepID=A0A0C2YT80_HEBCY|nr:hypothetical protein M413DRAFT_376682 [Hebeloma cylindrosporum h7]
MRWRSLLANFLSRVSPRGFLLLKTALEDLYEWLIEKTREHVRFGRERFPLLPRTTFYLLTLSIAVLVFLLAVISAFPADGVVRRPPPEDGNIREDVDGHDYGHSCDCGGYPGEGASNTASAEGGYDGEDEDHSSVGGEDASSQYSNSDGSLTVEKVGIDLDGGSDTEVELEKKQALENPGIVPERVEIVLKMAMDSETTTESDEFMSDFADEDKAVESTTVVGGFRGFEVDDSLVCNFEQTGSHGAANAAPLTSTQFLQIREEKELSSVASMAQAAPSTPMSYPTVAKHKRREIKVKRSPKIFRFPGPARKKVGVAPTKKKFSRRSLSTLRTISTTASSATLSRLNRISANQTISIAPPSSVSIFVPQRTRAKSFQDFMKNW